MAVKIIRKGASTSDSTIIKKSVPTVPIEGRPVLAKAVPIGKFTVLPDIDVHDVLGHAKFMVHLKREGQWFRVMGYDEQQNVLRLQSKVNNCFDSKIDRTAGRNYMVVMGPKDATTPSDEVCKYVRGLLDSVPEKAPWEGEDQMQLQPTAIEPAPEPKKKVTIFSKKGVKS